METNKIDKIIKQKLDDRSLTPSASAWERLSVQLDEQPKKQQKSIFFYLGVAASIALLFSVFHKVFNSDNEQITPKIEEVVIKKEDKELINDKIEKFINEIPVEEAFVKTKKDIKKTKVPTKKVIAKAVIPKKIIPEKEVKINKVDAIVNSKESNIKKEVIASTTILKRDPNSSIKINADDLLYAVTHTPEEVKTYYAKHRIKREDVLKTIKSELKKSNINIKPETILAEVESSIHNDEFQNNFMKTLKRKVSDIASAIASRND